jgi:hypothetical protein
MVIPAVDELPAGLAPAEADEVLDDELLEQAVTASAAANMAAAAADTCLCERTVIIYSSVVAVRPDMAGKSRHAVIPAGNVGERRSAGVGGHLGGP